VSGVFYSWSNDNFGSCVWRVLLPGRACMSSAPSTPSKLLTIAGTRVFRAADCVEVMNRKLADQRFVSEKFSSGCSSSPRVARNLTTRLLNFDAWSSRSCHLCMPEKSTHTRFVCAEYRRKLRAWQQGIALVLVRERSQVHSGRAICSKDFLEVLCVESGFFPSVCNFFVFRLFQFFLLSVFSEAQSF